MAGDIGMHERLVILPETASMSVALPAVTTAQSRVVHVYGLGSWLLKLHRKQRRL